MKQIYVYQWDGINFTINTPNKETIENYLARPHTNPLNLAIHTKEDVIGYLNWFKNAISKDLYYFVGTEDEFATYKHNLPVVEKGINGGISIVEELSNNIFSIVEQEYLDSVRGKDRHLTRVMWINAQTNILEKVIDEIEHPDNPTVTIDNSTYEIFDRLQDFMRTDYPRQYAVIDKVMGYIGIVDGKSWVNQFAKHYHAKVSAAIATPTLAGEMPTNAGGTQTGGQ